MIIVVDTQVFVLFVSAAIVVLVLVSTGLSHALRFTSFADTIRSHKILPARLCVPVALGVTLFELGLALLVGVATTGLTTTLRPALPFLACFALGVAFCFYVRALLRAPSAARAASCGCSPTRAPLTPASLTSAYALCIASLAGAAAGAFPSEGSSTTAALVLGTGWGSTLAVLLTFFPVVVPAAVRRPESP